MNTAAFQRPFGATTREIADFFAANRSVRELLQFGVINLDKPSGPTSHDVVEEVRRILRVKRVGHGGTLDPMVNGILPLGVKKGTRVLSYLLESGKTYYCAMKMHADFAPEFLREKLLECVGLVEQLPPRLSRVKREVRTREIYGFDNVEIDGRVVSFHISCQAGTYVRKFCYDFGVALGSCAHMFRLRRLRCGPLTEDSVCTLEQLREAYARFMQGDESLLRACVLPAEVVFADFPCIFLTEAAEADVRLGRMICNTHIQAVHGWWKTGDFVVAYTTSRKLAAITSAHSACVNGVVPVGEVAHPCKVFLEQLSPLSELSDNS